MEWAAWSAQIESVEIFSRQPLKSSNNNVQILIPRSFLGAAKKNLSDPRLSPCQISHHGFKQPNKKK